MFLVFLEMLKRQRVEGPRHWVTLGVPWGYESVP